MNRLLFFLLLRCLLPGSAAAHPPVALVMNSRGAIFYSDLEQVWMVRNGKRSLAVPGVHTHELYLDGRDNLYGEHLWYEGDATGRFNHFEWVLRPDGTLDTVLSPRQAYVRHDFSLARDGRGTEYYLKLQDTIHIYQKKPDGPEAVFASGSFGGVSWLHPQPDGSLLCFVRNGVYRIRQGGEIVRLATGIAGEHPTFSLASESRMVWGLWQDSAGAVYAAVFSDGKVKRLDRDGSIRDCYTSPAGWAPVQGLFDRQGTLWVLECSEKNEVRLVRAQIDALPELRRKSNAALIIAAVLCIAVAAYFIIYFKGRLDGKQAAK